jgi:hypothetical protein
MGREISSEAILLATGKSPALFPGILDTEIKENYGKQGKDKDNFTTEARRTRRMILFRKSGDADFLKPLSASGAGKIFDPRSGGAVLLCGHLPAKQKLNFSVFSVSLW